MIGLTCRKCENGINVRTFKVRILFQDRLARLARCQKTQNVRNSHAQIADARMAVHAIWIYRYSRQ
jgi:hypothetical protein